MGGAGGFTHGQEEAFGDDGCVYHFDGGDGSISQNELNGTL